jgi:succinate-semialdehyde dehydrogenase/glutarate-semialdehyde dehydrogenase
LHFKPRLTDNDMTYPNTQLFINGQWCDAQDGRTLPVFNPATGTEIGRLAHAGVPDLERAAQAAQKGFELWRVTPRPTSAAPSCAKPPS